MTVMLLLCRRHGGKYRRIGVGRSNRLPRCVACDIERRKLIKKEEPA